MQTLVIGIDGGEWDVIRPLVESGEVPNIAELIQDGVSGDLNSVVPPVSPPAWTSIQTGVNPGKHGIFDFMRYQSNYTRTWVNSSDRQATPFWRVMNEEGIDTGLFKVPMTYPPDQIDGFLVSGFPTPPGATDFARPLSITDKIGDPKTLFEDNYLKRAGDDKAYKDNIIKVISRQTSLFIELMEEYDPDFLMTVYDGADRIQHSYWHYFDKNHPKHDSGLELEDPVREYYSQVDDSIGRLQRKLPKDANIMIISDHGFGPLTHDIYIEKWLCDNGYFKFKGKDENKFKFRTISSNIIDFVWNILQRYRIDSEVMRLLPGSVAHIGRRIHSTHASERNWSQTAAFFTTPAGQAIIINLQERFENGSLTEDQYEELIWVLTNELEDLVNPDTEVSLIKNVYHRLDLWEGWAVENAPDIILQPNPQYGLKGGRSDKLVTPAEKHGRYRTGSHRQAGIFIGTGPAFRSGGSPNLEIYDIAPLLLYMFDCPLPQSMDGSVVKPLFKPSFNEERSVEFIDNYGQTTQDHHSMSEKEATEVVDTLEDLGYLG